jgi:hypothetical protein
MTRRIAILATLFVAGACTTSSPTAATADDARASQDGGLVLGSGNRSDSTGTGQQSTQGNGGLVLGSGN